VDGGWSDWGEWQACSETCGDGRQRRLRECNNPRPSGGGDRCAGSAVQFQQCNEGTCPGMFVHGGHVTFVMRSSKRKAHALLIKINGSSWFVEILFKEKQKVMKRKQEDIKLIQ